MATLPGHHPVPPGRAHQHRRRLPPPRPRRRPHHGNPRAQSHMRNGHHATLPRPCCRGARQTENSAVPVAGVPGRAVVVAGRRRGRGRGLPPIRSGTRRRIHGDGWPLDAIPDPFPGGSPLGSSMALDTGGGANVRRSGLTRWCRGLRAAPFPRRREVRPVCGSRAASVPSDNVYPPARPEVLRNR
jgi:hypothetical protein